MPVKKKVNIKTTKSVKTKTKKLVAKTSIKKPIKKSVNRKKSISRKRRKNLTVVWDEKCFFVHNGPALGSLADLSCWLSTADSENFEYHLVGGRNDFADWINNVLGDKDCASKIKKIKTSTGMFKIISRHLKENYV